MNRLLLVDELPESAGGFTLADLLALARLEGRLTVATRKRGASTRGEGLLPDGLAIRILPPDRRFRDPRRLLGNARSSLAAAARRPRAASRLHQRCRTTPSTRTSPLGHLLRHLPFLGMDADVVHFGSAELWLAYPLLPSLLDAPSVVTCHGAQLDAAERGARHQRASLVRALTRATGVECPSVAIAERVRELTSRSTGIWVRPATIDVERVPAKPMDHDGHPPLIMAVGRLAYTSGFDHLLLALARLQRAGISFRAEILGDGPLRRPLQYAIDDLALTNDVTLQVGPRGVQLEERLRHADIFVASGLETAFDDVVARAMAVGLPVVTTSVPDAPELVRDSVEGFVVPARDVNALADRLCRLAGNASECRSLGSAARARVARDFGLERQAARFEEMYEGVLGQWGRAAASRARPEHRAAAINRPTIGSYCRTFPKATDTVTKVLGLLDAGFDVQIFAGEASGYWRRFPALIDRPDLRGRVHFLGGRERPPWGGAGPVRQLVSIAARRPIAFLRFVSHNWRTRKTNTLGFWKGIRLRVPFVGQSLDVLHVENDSWGAVVADLKEYLGCRLLLSSLATLQHEISPDGGPVPYEYLFRLVDGYHFGSDYLKSNTLALGLDPSVPTWVIKSAIDLEVFEPPPRRSRRSPDEIFRIVSVGRLAWWKGYQFALEAVARVREAGVPATYTIIGEGALEADIRSVAHELDLDGVVRFAGGLPTEVIVEELRAADVMLHAAVDEGMSIAVLEAMATELPVVTTDAGGNPEGVDDGVTGYVVPRRDAQGLADKLILLAGDPERGWKMGQAGRERVLANFDLRQRVSKFATLYLELAALPARAMDRQPRRASRRRGGGRG